MADAVALNEFDSDTHRRVAANLSVPRSSRDLAAFLARHDQYVDERAHDPSSVEDFLLDLESDGLVKRLGTLGTAKDAIATLRDDDDLPTLPKEKAAGFVERAERDDVFPYLADEEQWVMTQAALDRINGPVPGEPPPLTGSALKAAEKENARLAAESEEAEREGRRRAAEALREEADRLEGGADA